MCHQELTARLSWMCKGGSRQAQKLLQDRCWANAAPSRALGRTQAFSAAVGWPLGIQRLHVHLKTLFWWTLFHNTLWKLTHASCNVVATKPPYVPDVHHLTSVKVPTNETTHQLKCLQFTLCRQTFKSSLFSKSAGKSEQAMIRNVFLESWRSRSGPQLGAVNNR